MWETVSTFVSQFSQDRWFELLAFLIETKDTTILQLAKPPAHNENIEPSKLETDFLFFFFMSAFIGKLRELAGDDMQHMPDLTL